MNQEFKGIFPMGAPNTPPANSFVGQSYLSVLCSEGLTACNVTFEPGCHNNWHIHHKGGQLLLCTAGTGYYQEWGKSAQQLHPGDVVCISPEIKHWHGASPNSWFEHVAIAIPAEGSSTQWLEAIDEAEYLNLK